jgi:hypothetical protein
VGSIYIKVHRICQKDNPSGYLNPKAQKLNLSPLFSWNHFHGKFKNRNAEISKAILWQLGISKTPLAVPPHKGLTLRVNKETV